MSRSSIGQLKIKYVNGEEQIFECELEDTSDPSVEMRVKECIQTRILTLALGEGMIFVPLDNVQSIQVSPQQIELPAITIQKARIMK